MKGYRFYLEYDTPTLKRHCTHSGTVIATFGDPFISLGHAMIECIGSVYNEPNSPVCCTSANLDYIHDYCKRISEVKAREIHPKLFERLDSED